MQAALKTPSILLFYSQDNPDTHLQQDIPRRFRGENSNAWAKELWDGNEQYRRTYEHIFERPASKGDNIHGNLYPEDGLY